jgi:hypothetical protein
MSDHPDSLVPPQLNSYEANRAKFPLEELAKYPGQFVAFSLDGTRIIAHAATRAELWQKLEEAGIHPSQVVDSYVDGPDDEDDRFV